MLTLTRAAATSRLTSLALSQSPRSRPQARLHRPPTCAATGSGLPVLVVVAPGAASRAPCPTKPTCRPLLTARRQAPHTHTVSQISATGTADATTYLRGDGTWSTPPAGGAVAARSPVWRSLMPLALRGLDRRLPALAPDPDLSANLQSWSGIAPSSKADLDSPVFTGNPTAPTPRPATTTRRLRPRPLSKRRLHDQYRHRDQRCRVWRHDGPVHVRRAG